MLATAVGKSEGELGHYTDDGASIFETYLLATSKGGHIAVGIYRNYLGWRDRASSAGVMFKEDFSTKDYTKPGMFEPETLLIS